MMIDEETNDRMREERNRFDMINKTFLGKKRSTEKNQTEVVKGIDRWYCKATKNERSTEIDKRRINVMKMRFLRRIENGIKIIQLLQIKTINRCTDIIEVVPSHIQYVE